MLENTSSNLKTMEDEQESEQEAFRHAEAIIRLYAAAEESKPLWVATTVITRYKKTSLVQQIIGLKKCVSSGSGEPVTSWASSSMNKTSKDK